jgi:hypothetical protein
LELFTRATTTLKHASGTTGSRKRRIGKLRSQKMLNTMSITSRNQGADFAEDLFKAIPQQTEADKPAKTSLLARVLVWIGGAFTPAAAGTTVDVA